ncbi:unnamed protein product [Candidula unifasciata]|uniref:RabBD domain-containing protein n=1 Tax=Candidula unifasciata TaxID=100452 RepID=A0A8S3YYD1_9EUPU|nr:unnamed protein product [Candidula unifasciata]
MPEHFKRTTGHARELTEAVKGPTLDLTTLTDQEEKIIQAVIQKDEVERSILEAKISEVRREIQEIRKAGALSAGDDQNAICARCKFKFLPFIVPWADHGQRCGTCKFTVCAKCRSPQPGGSWLCVLCFKYRQEKQLTGEFMSKGQPIASTLYGSDLLRASLRDRTTFHHPEKTGLNRIQQEHRDIQIYHLTDGCNLLKLKNHQKLLLLLPSGGWRSLTSPRHPPTTTCLCLQ